MTESTRTPLVVIVDDERDNVVDLSSDLRQVLDVQAVEPYALTHELLRDGTIFLLDMFLRDWPGRAEHEPASRIYDGIALAGAIRSYAREYKWPPPVVALNTGHPDEFSGLPSEIREHAIARAHNLEWVFLKHGSASGVSTRTRVVQLAQAQERLPPQWSQRSGEDDLLRVLGATRDELAEILDAWPPIREVGSDTGGVAVLRWLLQRILPYPCFLLDRRHVAARLGLTCQSLAEASTRNDDLGAALEACRYTGILAEFDGPRWWRSRLESMLWERSIDGSLPAGTRELQTLTSTGLVESSVANGVVVLDADYIPRDEPVEVTSAVRIRLDDWPPYAEQAWASIDDARDEPRLRERVLPIDRVQLGG